MSEQHYRPDIDGLRAVAVGLVLLFHSGLAFPGGFVGVDVFFVISGYLITGLILKQQQAGTFRLSDFWTRRIRRIVPAAFVMAFATLVAGAFLIFPEDYAKLAKSTIAHQLMYANVFFCDNTGYFDGPADLKPMLHTWSLAVEEQFYLVYPLCLVVLGRLRRSAAVCVLGAVALTSLMISEWGVRSDPNSAFYLLPSRAWELLLGGLLCYVPVKTPRGRNVTLHCLGAIGLGMILVTAFLYNARTQFPGIAALLPCSGAVLLIYANSSKLTVTGRLLAWKPFVFVGLISYSLYLWHWPIFAFARYLFGHHIPLPAAVLMLLASFVLAVCSWRFVETPLRRPLPLLRQNVVLRRICATVPLLIFASVVVVAGRGFPSRIPEAVSRYLAVAKSRDNVHEMSLKQVERNELPTFGVQQATRRCLVWGDSHAMALVAGINEACRAKGLSGFQVTHSATAPLFDFVFHTDSGLNDDAPEFSRAVMEIAKQNDIDVVILAGFWSDYAGNPAFERQLTRTLDELKQAGMDVAIVLDVAIYDEEVPVALARRAFLGKPTADYGVAVATHKSKNDYCDGIIRRVATGRATVIDPASFFVDRELWRAEIDGVVMYRDIGHLSAEGAVQLSPLFEMAFDSFGEKRIR